MHKRRRTASYGMASEGCLCCEYRAQGRPASSDLTIICRMNNYEHTGSSAGKHAAQRPDLERVAQCRRKPLPHRPRNARSNAPEGAAPARGCRGGTSRAIGRNGPGCPGPAAHAGHPRSTAYRGHSRRTPWQAWPRAQRAAGAQRARFAADADHPGSAAHAGHPRAAAHRRHAGLPAHRGHAGLPAHRGHAARQARQTLPQRKAPQEKLRHPQGGGLVLARAGRRERRRPGRAGSRVCLPGAPRATMCGTRWA